MCLFCNHLLKTEGGGQMKNGGKNVLKMNSKTNRNCFAHQEDSSSEFSDLTRGSSSLEKGEISFKQERQAGFFDCFVI